MSLASTGNRTPDHRAHSPVTISSTVTGFIMTSDSYCNIVQAPKCNHFSVLNPLFPSMPTVLSPATVAGGLVAPGPDDRPG
jgi:hypothetical protein